MWLWKGGYSKTWSWFCRHQLRQTISWTQVGHFLLLWWSRLLINWIPHERVFSFFIWLNWLSRNIFQSFLDNMNYRVKIMVPKCCVCICSLFWVSLVYWVNFTVDSTSENSSLAFYYQVIRCVQIFLLPSLTHRQNTIRWFSQRTYLTQSLKIETWQFRTPILDWSKKNKGRTGKKMVIIWEKVNTKLEKYDFWFVGRAFRTRFILD